MTGGRRLRTQKPQHNRPHPVSQAMGGPQHESTFSHASPKWPRTGSDVSCFIGISFSDTLPHIVLRLHCVVALHGQVIILVTDTVPGAPGACVPIIAFHRVSFRTDRAYAFHAEPTYLLNTLCLYPTIRTSPRCVGGSALSQAPRQLHDRGYTKLSLGKSVPTTCGVSALI
ncbi:hypothetical protein BDV95DRAFT_141496 [Massariosphaeria phaeospora]|uniref:Uncharacterized protein n=1 Tax=Massariosphaeria phaeospora TaxID=100035 RepID=A0A7C8IDW5_9PLEO|nr:hypothetical protein BDV95DRAFT_141496 [Massariosphaeria phaeospora]